MSGESPGLSPVGWMKSIHDEGSKETPSCQALNQLVGSFLKGVNKCFRSLIDSVKEFFQQSSFLYLTQENIK